MANDDLGGLMLMHEPGHCLNALAGQGSQDTEWTGKDAKLIAQRDADPLLAVVHRQHPPSQPVLAPSPAGGRGGGGGRSRALRTPLRAICHFGAWTETSTRYAREAHSGLMSMRGAPARPSAFDRIARA